jgi:hypothetical protein
MQLTKLEGQKKNLHLKGGGPLNSKLVCNSKNCWVYGRHVEFVLSLKPTKLFANLGAHLVVAATQQSHREVKKVQEVELGMDDTNMTAMTHIDDEADCWY